MSIHRPLIAVLVASGAVGVSPAAATYKTFQTPSKQIRCAYIVDSDVPAQIRCDPSFFNDRAIVLTHTGKARKIKVTDTVANPKARILKYGTTTSFGSFTCTSRRTGLTCRSRRSGHGFTISRQAQKLF